MPKAFHFVPNTQLIFVFFGLFFKSKNTLNKVHYLQGEIIGERPKDRAGSGLESHPGMPLIVIRENSTKRRGGR